MSRTYRLARRALFKLEPERAHRLAVRVIASGMLPGHRPDPDPRLKRKLLGHEFANPIGIAAGFDKDGEAVDGLFGLGFGFVEVGTVTPRPQEGNPRPRVFRLPGDRALINRLGFNNCGHEALYRRLIERKAKGGIVGVNIGANRDSLDRIDDYVLGVRRFAEIASYLTVNISSPNTKNLRDLQDTARLKDLLGRLLQAREELAQRHGRKVPLLVKLAPDLDAAALAGIAALAQERGVGGLIATNTTIQRPGLDGVAAAAEQGGLSGAPLRPLALQALRTLRAAVGPDFPLIGVGGILGGADARARREAGADLVQIYTGFIYRGPALVAECATALLPAAAPVR